MNLIRFLKDQWRLVICYLVGNSLSSSVLLLWRAETGVPVSWQIAGYASGLALFTLWAYLLWEYAIRLPFYRDVQSRLSRDQSIAEGGVPLAAVTEEHKLCRRLLMAYQAAYSRSLMALEERQQLFETFTMRFAHQMKTPVTVLRLLEQEIRQKLPVHAQMCDPLVAHEVDCRAPGKTMFDQMAESDVAPRRVDGGRGGALAGVVVREWMEQLADETARMEALIEAMIYTARLNAFSFDSHMEAVDVVAALREIVNRHKSEWIRQRIYPRLETHSQGVWVATDRKWFAFIAEQIVRNALQYGYKLDGKGERTSSTFVIRVDDLGEEVRVAFADEGIGIPERDLSHVFEPFFTGANGRSHSRATGMGLYLVKEVAERLGHRVGIESEAGKGTTVVLWIQRSDYYRPASELQHM